MVLDSIDVYEISWQQQLQKNVEIKVLLKKLLDKIKTKDIFLEVRKNNEKAINFYKKK